MQEPISRTVDAIMDHHIVLRDGSVWWCRYCKRTWPYPQPLPVPPTPCIPRRWGDQP